MSQILGEDVLDGVGPQRFGDVVVHSHGKTQFPVAHHRIGGHGDNIDLPGEIGFTRRLAFADKLCGFQSSITGICTSIRISL